MSKQKKKRHKKRVRTSISNASVSSETTLRDQINGGLSANRDSLIRSIGAPIQEISNVLGSSVFPTIRRGVEVGQAYALGPQVGESLRELRELSESISKAFAEVAPKWNLEIGKIARRLADYPKDTQRQIAVLLDNGWSIDPDMHLRFIGLLVSTMEQGEPEEAELWVIDHFEARLDGIQTQLAERHPERSAILADAFQAHRDGRYNLSVPAFLAQADGIVANRFEDRQLYSRAPKSNLEHEISSMDPEMISTMWVDKVLQGSTLTSSSKKLPKDFKGLNRHAVLHGTDLNYGTKSNSLKALSTLNMASFFVASNPLPEVS